MMFKVSAAVLQTLKCLNVENEDAILYFAGAYERAIVCPPNFRLYGKERRIWIVRDFFPGTKLFFKMVVVPNDIEGDYNGVVKVSMVDPMGHRTKNTHIRPDLDLIKKYVAQQLEYEILGSDKKPESFLSLNDRKIANRAPKRMFPKGYVS